MAARRRPRATLSMATSFPLFASLFCLALAGSACKPSVLKTRVMTTTNMQTKIPGLCMKCGEAADVCVFKTRSLPGADPGDVAVFCEKCALQAIREMPRCPQLMIVADQGTGANRARRIRREYQV